MRAIVSVVVAALTVAACESHPDVAWPPAPPLVPSIPSGVSLQTDHRSIEVSWSANPDGEQIAHYVVYGAAEDWTSWDASMVDASRSLAGSCCSFILTGLPNDLPHWIGVAAVNDQGESSPSAALAATPPGSFGLRQGGTATSDFSEGIAFGPTGDIYVVGSTYSDLDGESLLGGSDGFLIRYRPNGTRVWTRLIGTPADDAITAVSVDENGRAFVVGYTNGAFPGESPQGMADAFVAKVTTSGTISWLHQIGTSGSDSALGAAVLGTNFYCVAGIAAGNLDGETNAGGLDAFVSLYDGSGTRQWTRLIGTTGAESGNAVAIAPSGKIYVSGTTTGALQGSVIGGADGFVSERLSNGGQTWIRQFGSTTNDDVDGVAVDEGRDRVYISGDTFGSFGGEVLSGSSDPFVLAYDRGPGTVAWTRFIGGTGGENAAQISLAPSGDIFAAYYASQPVSLQDVLVVAMSSAGDPAWTSVIGSGSLDYFGGLSADDDGNVYVTGQTMGSVGAPNAGGWDYFLGKLGPDGIIR